MRHVFARAWEAVQPGVARGRWAGGRGRGGGPARGGGGVGAGARTGTGIPPHTYRQHIIKILTHINKTSESKIWHKKMLKEVVHNDCKRLRR